MRLHESQQADQDAHARLVVHAEFAENGPRQNIRDYGMYIALFVIMVFFTWHDERPLHLARETSPTC